MTDEQARSQGGAEALDTAAALAGQVAHDLGNVLTVVMCNAEILAEVLAADPAKAGLAARILRAAQRGTGLVERLNLFARHIPAPATPTEVGAVVAAQARRLRETLPAGVSLEVEVEPGLRRVALDPDALTRALDELAENAVAALAGGGRIWLRAASGAGGRVLVGVADDGPGMAAAALRRGGAPTFGSGVAAHKTGLGLALAARIAMAGGGRLVLADRPGGGTAATLDLPGVC
jgi:signal transduction histidine kinase